MDPGCKAEFAKLFGVECSSLYRCTKRQNERDVQDIDELVATHLDNPRQGYSFKELTNPSLKIWVQDFTYIKYKGRHYFLAATMRLASRDIVGWSFSLHHDKNLVCNSLQDALSKHLKPNIVHNDQGSEYLSEAHTKICRENGIEMSASDPSSPWQNGYMERFFNTFKEEISERLKHAKTEEEIYQIIAKWIYYYQPSHIYQPQLYETSHR